MMLIKSVARAMDHMPRFKRRSALDLAHKLGWFSIGLGLFELASRGGLARAFGMRGSEPLFRFYGLREIGTGVGILTARDPSPFVWGRVAGDALDLATLAAGLLGSRRKLALTLATGTVGVVTIVDLICAQTLSTDMKRKSRPIPDYSHRSGLPKGIDETRGLATLLRTPKPSETAHSIDIAPNR